MTSATDSTSPACRTPLDFWLRSVQLLQENQEQWLHLCSQIAQEDLRLLQSEMTQLQQAKDVNSLALLVPMAGLHAIQERMAALQGMAQTALNNQTALHAGYHKAWSELQAASEQPHETVAASAPAKAAKPRSSRAR